VCPALLVPELSIKEWPEWKNYPPLKSIILNATSYKKRFCKEGSVIDIAQ